MKNLKKLGTAAVCAGVLGACSGGVAPQAGEENSADAVMETAGPIRLNVFYTANDGADHARIAEIAAKLVEASRGDEGCIGYDFYASGTTPGEYIIVETWASDSALDVHSHAPHFTEYVPMLHEMGEMRLERCSIENE